MNNQFPRVREVSTLQTQMGRWILVLPAARDWAWTGSRWAEHRDGLSREAQISNWPTEQEALQYAQEHLLQREGGNG